MIMEKMYVAPELEILVEQGFAGSGPIDDIKSNRKRNYSFTSVS